MLINLGYLIFMPMKKQKNNIAFIDGQNLYLGTTESKKPWKINLARLRIYLKEKYGVEKAYYFLGCVDDNLQDLYDFIQESGFILKFREHSSIMIGKKKGNVDTEIVFDIMRRLYLKEEFDKVILISGDGDYKKLVDFLIEQKKFEKILFPNLDFASSLYKELGSEFFDRLDKKGIRNKIKLKKKRTP